MVTRRNVQQWQPPWMPDYKQQTAGLAMEARRRGWSDSRIKNRFQDMGIDLREMAGYSLPPKSPQQQYGLLKNQERDQQKSVADNMLGGAGLNPFESIWGRDTNKYRPQGSPEDGRSWWDTIGSTLGKEGPLGGLKGWLDIGTDVAKVGLGYKMLGQSEEENRIARDNLAFQKDAFWKNYGNQVTAYNQIAYDRQAWKDANDPNRERYAQETIIPV